MLGTVLLLIAGWFRNWIAAAIIAALSFAAQLAFVLPRVTEQRQLLGLQQVDMASVVGTIAVQVAALGLAFYFAGYGARRLWEKRNGNVR